MVARDITLMGLSLTNCSNTGHRIMAASTPRCGQVVARQYLMIEPAHREWAGPPALLAQQEQHGHQARVGYRHTRADEDEPQPSRRHRQATNPLPPALGLFGLLPRA